MHKKTYVLFLSFFSLVSYCAMDNQPCLQKCRTSSVAVKTLLKDMKDYAQMFVFSRGCEDYPCKKPGVKELCKGFSAYRRFMRELATPSPDPKIVQRKDSGLGLSFHVQELNGGKRVSTSLKTQEGVELAFAQAGILESEEHWCLGAIAVERVVRGRGLGSEIFHKTMDEIKKRGCKRVDIDPDANVDISEEDRAVMSVEDLLDRHRSLHRFYRKLGAVYEEDGDGFIYTIPNN
jgi:GNAT superfamily N-acetyltransferase